VREPGDAPGGPPRLCSLDNSVGRQDTGQAGAAPHIRSEVKSMPAKKKAAKKAAKKKK
jgi:hypothetical protein